MTLNFFATMSIFAWLRFEKSNVFQMALKVTFDLAKSPGSFFYDSTVSFLWQFENYLLFNNFF